MQNPNCSLDYPNAGTTLSHGTWRGQTCGLGNRVIPEKSVRRARVEPLVRERDSAQAYQCGTRLRLVPACPSCRLGGHLLVWLAWFANCSACIAPGLEGVRKGRVVVRVRVSATAPLAVSASCLRRSLRRLGCDRICRLRCEAVCKFAQQSSFSLQHRKILTAVSERQVQVLQFLQGPASHGTAHKGFVQEIGQEEIKSQQDYSH